MCGRDLHSSRVAPGSVSRQAKVKISFESLELSSYELRIPHGRSCRRTKVEIRKSGFFLRDFMGFPWEWIKTSKNRLLRESGSEFDGSCCLRKT